MSSARAAERAAASERAGFMMPVREIRNGPFSASSRSTCGNSWLALFRLGAILARSGLSHLMNRPLQSVQRKERMMAVHSFTVVYEAAEEGGYYAQVPALDLTTEATALTHKVPLVTADAKLHAAPVPTVW